MICNGFVEIYTSKDMYVGGNDCLHNNSNKFYFAAGKEFYISTGKIKW